MMKQSNCSFTKLLLFFNLALLAILLFNFFPEFDEVDAADDTIKTEIPAKPALMPSTDASNIAKECGERSYENAVVHINYDIDHTGKKIGEATYELLCPFQWHLAKFYKDEVSRKNPSEIFYTLGRKKDSEGNPTYSRVERFDIRSGDLIAPPTERVDVSWCSQAIQGLNRKAPWEFAVHACMLLYKRIILSDLNKRFKGGLISEQDYRAKTWLLARDGRKDVDWQPASYEYKLDFSDYSFFGVKYLLNKNHL